MDFFIVFCEWVMLYTFWNYNNFAFVYHFCSVSELHI